MLPEIRTDDDILIFAAARAARAAHLLGTPSVPDEVVNRARVMAREIADEFFLTPAGGAALVNVSPVAVTLAAGYARRLSETLDELLRTRADSPAPDLLSDAYHLCRHLRVPLDVPDPLDGTAPVAGFRAHLRERIGAARQSA